MAGLDLCHQLEDEKHVHETINNSSKVSCESSMQVCAICLNSIKVEDLAVMKGCEHAYCVTCILRWASYKKDPWCPQCKVPFDCLYSYRTLDGKFEDYLVEESVCLLLRACWFKPLVVQEQDDQQDYHDDYDLYEESYHISNLRLGNRRWGDSGYIRAGRREARPVAPCNQDAGSSSRQVKGKEPSKETIGRRARRSQKREQSDRISGKK
ncbi:hypothetical protein KP509_10G049400 [Ceratopteris richardii]|uniref:RING-type domain-containing protein n=1 Tax=Ceratopteris richardii TaxID=49495 RepID=A0A8T2U1N2_CERRI|nr:hypothetical protein KP509_10G049400 [Ceratopteris richardii]KAH7427566.1 hypothetical protein KP509_10G049400 [Ceratopteris richardii]